MSLSGDTGDDVQPCALWMVGVVCAGPTVCPHRDSTGLFHACVLAGSSQASVTLASALQVRGEALSEEEIWSLLSLAGERLLEDLRHGKRACGQRGPFF